MVPLVEGHLTNTFTILSVVTHMLPLDPTWASGKQLSNRSSSEMTCRKFHPGSPGTREKAPPWQAEITW